MGSTALVFLVSQNKKHGANGYSVLFNMAMNLAIYSAKISSKSAHHEHVQSHLERQ